MIGSRRGIYHGKMMVVEHVEKTKDVSIRMLVIILFLVGGLVAMFYFPINIGLLIIPIDELLFFRGVALAHQPVLLVIN